MAIVAWCRIRCRHCQRIVLKIVKASPVKHARLPATNFQASLLLDRVGVPVCFGLSGKPWVLMQYFGLCTEHIADRVRKLHAKRARAPRQAE